MPLAAGISAARSRRAKIGAAREEQRRRVHECAPRERAVFEQRGAERVARIRRGRRHEPRRARVLGRGQPDPEVEAERTGEFVAEIAPERAPADPAHHLAHEPTERDRVVAVARAGLPVRRLTRECAGHRVPVQAGLRAQRLVDRGEARAVVEQEPHGDPLLARRRELGPVARDGRLDVEGAARGEPVRAQCGGALRARVHHHERVFAPGPLARGVGEATPQVDDALPVDDRAQRGAELAVRGEVVRERVAHAREARVARPLDLAAHARMLASPLRPAEDPWPHSIFATSPISRCACPTSSARSRSTGTGWDCA
jgi:hypothetical protein